MKRILLTLFTLMVAFDLTACDICGCGVGNYYFGLLPQFNHKFFGIRYRYLGYHSKMADDPLEFSRDKYQIMEAWGGWNIGKKWQIMGILPYQINHQVSDQGTTHLTGIGDVVVMGNYRIFDIPAHRKGSGGISQQLWFGTGIKLPTGKFVIDPANPDKNAAANTQQGSGSVDILFNAVHHIQTGNIGLNTNLNYKLNTENKENYKFGNRFTASTIGYYMIAAGKGVISPNLGILYEYSSPSRDAKTTVDDSGGYATSATGGLEINLGKWLFGASMQIPFAQNYASGQTKLDGKGMVYVTFVL